MEEPLRAAATPRRTGEHREADALDADVAPPRRTGLKIAAATVLVGLIAAAAFALGRHGAPAGTPAPRPVTATQTESAPVRVLADGASASRARVKKTTTTFTAAQKNYGELQIDVMVNGQPVRARVTLDGEEVGQAPLAIPAKAGKHSLRIAHEGVPGATITAQLASGTSLHYEVDLDPAD
ncbi:MAG: PEGA domain-containing protein [Myxococcaceae bacterium]|nr:PEGA domain-containing protein [Myxococcaceae bacterium]